VEADDPGGDRKGLADDRAIGRDPTVASRRPAEQDETQVLGDSTPVRSEGGRHEAAIKVQVLHGEQGRRLPGLPGLADPGDGAELGGTVAAEGRLAAHEPLPPEVVADAGPVDPTLPDRGPVDLPR
jgi:hypothetical protein